jgi:hypothetical protein
VLLFCAAAYNYPIHHTQTQKGWQNTNQLFFFLPILKNDRPLKWHFLIKNTVIYEKYSFGKGGLCYVL